MSLRRSLSVPIILAIVMITLLVVLTVGWVLMTAINALKDTDLSGVYWALCRSAHRSSYCWPLAWCST